MTRRQPLNGLIGSCVDSKRRMRCLEALRALLLLTRYLKWVTRQPWPQSTRANRSGRLVAVETASSGDRLVAHVVRIATE